MSYVKRQMARKRYRQSLGTLSKSPSVSDFEYRQAEFLMRYGKNWVRHWREDHPGMYEVKKS